ncbi:hypothetical protein XCR_0366 [Xanthomonas campestris pv. raphani 756C]|nr:hypothetical protein XCR_0366 [Xanthomonas campestris pv. raphani 756C]
MSRAPMRTPAMRRAQRCYSMPGERDSLARAQHRPLPPPRPVAAVMCGG